MKFKFTLFFFSIFFSNLVLAENIPANPKELFFIERANCPWTDLMGKDLHKCIVDSNGFNATMCHQEVLALHCSKASTH